MERLTGVELSISRHELALAATRALAPTEAARIRLRCADCADESLLGGVLEDATVLWVCSELFSNALMGQVGARTDVAR